ERVRPGGTCLEGTALATVLAHPLLEGLDGRVVDGLAAAHVLRLVHVRTSARPRREVVRVVGALLHPLVRPGHRGLARPAAHPRASGPARLGRLGALVDGRDEVDAARRLLPRTAVTAGPVDEPGALLALVLEQVRDCGGDDRDVDLAELVDRDGCGVSR